MLASEKYDKVIEEIESKIKRLDNNSAKIANEVAQSCGISTRDLSTVFMFLTGRTLHQYIRERKMMAAYESIIDGERFDVQQALLLTGYGDQPAFNKIFKSTFNCTPKEAFDRKNLGLIKLKITWSEMGKTEIAPVYKSTEANILKHEKIFGLERSKYDQVKEIIGLQDIFQFDELQCETAYRISTLYDLLLEDAFQFVSEFKYNDKPYEINEDALKESLGLPQDYQFAPEENEEYFQVLSREEYFKWVESLAADEEIRYVYFKTDVSSIYIAFRVIDKLHFSGEPDATKVDVDVISICAYDEIDVGYCKRAVQYYKEHATEEYGDDAFQEYVEYILQNKPIEIAFANIVNTEGWDDVPNVTLEEYQESLNEYDPDDPFEKWAQEETDYYSGKYDIEEW